MRYKMIVLDLDGTLTNNQKQITPKTKEALINIQEKGVKVVLASGRPTYGITPLANELKINRYNGFILAFNGGKIIDYSAMETVFEQTIDKPVVEVLYNAAQREGMAILTYQGQGIVTSQKANNYVEHEALINKMPVAQYNDFVNQVQYPLNKCLIVGDPQPLKQLGERLSQVLKGQAEVYRSANFFLECVPPGVDKAQSLERLLEITGISRDEVVAVGDGYNDVSMLEYAGLGVAMANSPEEVKEHANYVTTADNENDGVAEVVEKFFVD